MKPLTCWVVTDGKPGMVNQALGLAEAMGLETVDKRIAVRSPWRQLSPYLRLGLAYCLKSQSDRLNPPWPDVVISCGRHSIPAAFYVKQASAGKTRLVYIQNPVTSSHLFDAIIAPKHDKLTGRNVLQSVAALHRVTPERLASEKKKFAHLGELPSPRIAVLLGGTNRAFQFSQEAIEKLAHQLHDLQNSLGASLLITPSRRTDAGVIDALRVHLSQENLYIWDEQGENPYFAMLAWADAVLVSCESVSMVTEACATAVPVYMLRLPGGDPKAERFHEEITSDGRVQWFEGAVDLAPQQPINETLSLAPKVRELLGL